MAFGARGKFPPGRKGMRQNNGKKAGVKLKPAPSASMTAQTTTARQQDASNADDQEEDDTEEEEIDELGMQPTGLAGERRPLEGVTVTVTGLSKQKSALLDMARELGATIEEGLTLHTTHLVAETAGSAKYEVSPGKVGGTRSDMLVSTVLIPLLFTT